MTQFKKFPSIEQFRNVVREVKHRATYKGLDENNQPIYDGSAILPKLRFLGSVKLHGTNAGIVYTWDPLSFEYVSHVQSRSNIITPLKDNAGFATFVHSINPDTILEKLMKVHPMDYTPNEIEVFGEWCGGNIQSNVALNGLDKMFVIFAIKIDEVWLNHEILREVKIPESKVYNIFDYETYEIVIDFNQSESSVNKIIELTTSVEDECPVAKQFGSSGIGEGIVFRCIEEGYNSSRFWFKSKGDKHAGKSKVKTMKPVDDERINKINELAQKLTPVWRLDQMLTETFDLMNGGELTKAKLGEYIKAVSSDVVKEELDTIVESGFEVKDVMPKISNIARLYYFERENQTDSL